MQRITKYPYQNINKANQTNLSFAGNSLKPAQPVFMCHPQNNKCAAYINKTALFTTKIQYNMKDLFAIKPKATNFQCTDLNFCVHLECHKKTKKRGCRGGKRKQKQIKTVFIPRLPRAKERGINQSNLIDVCLNPFLKIIYFNAQSCSNDKAIDIHDLILEAEADMVFLTETWFKPNGDEAKIAARVPIGYIFISAPRTTREGGGIALFYKTAIKIVKEDKTRQSDSFEQLTVKIKTSKSYLTCVCVYRLRPKKKHGITWDQFFNDFPMFLESLNKEKELLITGDFNLHLKLTMHPTFKV
ncbi:ATP-dependent DNA helicase [Elysia marginata]|uniref:ATP-dependent DNA helicase n=1 Tax=Elysia marginata TaxID=1093978 RepID=A0AAV4FVL7_9GAST|nr:ATP-dependent DNA helicase [Elysia marginata]